MTPRIRLVSAAALLAFPSITSAQTRDPGRVQAAVDSIVAAALAGGRVAGMSVAVVRGADTLVLKGYGRADLELDVPTPPRAVYEIGSATKQFTAASILLLQEQGKLSLDDDITRFLPSYPTKGVHLTIRRLLDHTSGIKGYTELPEFGTIMSRSLPRDSLVVLFSTKPADFAPGDAMVYNNSAFFLLGLVIEKASGQSYADFVKKNLFDRAGMPDSRYCSVSDVVKRRAHGYDVGPNGLVLAAYIDQLWPYAAGSLCSTAWDLAAWVRALHGGRILSPASYRELITPGALNDGTRLRYAKGLAVDTLGGHFAIQHGGDIPGFATEVDYFPADSLTVVVLINTEGPVRPNAIAQSIEQVVLGPPVVGAAVAFHGHTPDYVGEYRGVGRGREAVIKIVGDSMASGGLAIVRGTAKPRALIYVGGDSFELDAAPYAGRERLTFVRANGRITGVHDDATFGNVLLKRTP
ncbi:MAG: Penicillin-binding protein 4 [Gemmatimonadetes bacterium]|nr:Penicillin-binding protein 4 [Gemmatimonadota bacterium]